MGSTAASLGWHLLLRGVPRLEPASPSSGGNPPAATAAPDAATGPSQALLLNPPDAAWLALIALGGGMPTARVATLVWPGQASEAGALNNLRQRVLRLRRRTGARLVELAAVPVLAPDLRCTPLDHAALRDDPHAWDGEWLAAHDHAGLAEFGTWLARQRHALADRRREALAGLAAEAESAGELARALRFASVLQQHEPLSEHAARRLMRLHYLRGDRAAAVAVFEACEALLRDELGVRPGAETLALLQTIEAAVPPAKPSPAPGPVPVGLLQPPRLVGRDALLAELAQAHADGAIAVVVGEAGIGKTRLLRSHAALHPGAVYVQARPGDAGVPFGLALRWLAALGQAVPDIQGAADRLQWWAVESVVAGAMARGADAMLLDDLHFADAASLDLLRRLLDSDRLTALPWLLAHRSPAAIDDLAGLLDSLREAPRARWLQVPALDEAGCAELLRSLNLPNMDSAALAPPLWRHSGGNPLYVLETLRVMRGADGRWCDGELPRPLAIGHLITQRLARLSKPALALARVAAVAAPDFSAALAEKALCQPAAALADAWAELEAADVLRGEGFAHDLVQDAVRNSVPEAIRRHLHRLVAAHLGAVNAEPARMAGHWWEGQCWPEAGRALHQAGVRSLMAGRVVEAVDQLWLASQAWLQAGQPLAAAEVVVEAVLATCNTQGPGPALARLDELRDALTAPACRQLWHAARTYAMVHGADLAGAAAEGAAAVAVRPQAQDPAVFEAGVALAFVQLSSGASADALCGIARLQAAAGWPDPPREHQWLRYWQAASSAHLFAHQLQAAAQAVHASLALARRLGHRDDEITGLLNLTSLSLRAGAMRSTLRHGRRLHAMVVQRDDFALARAGNCMYMGLAAVALGRLADGLAWSVDAQAELVRLRHNPATHARCANQRALALIALGQAGRAMRLLADDTVSLQGAHLAERWMARAALARHQGRSDAEALAAALSALAGAEGGAAALEVQIGLARHQPPGGTVLARLRELRHAAEQQGWMGLALLAAAEHARLSLAWGLTSPELAGSQILELQALGRQAAHPDATPAEVALLRARLHRCAGQVIAARRCLRAAIRLVRWQVAHQVPAEFRDSFLGRTPLQLAICQDDARWGAGEWSLVAQCLSPPSRHPLDMPAR